MRDSFIIYRSFYDAICDLPKENQAEVFMAICAFSLDKQECELTGLSATIFKLIRPQLEANYRKFENGKKPKQKQNGSKTEAKQKQTGSKTEANVNVNVNVNDNDNDNVNVNENENVIVLSANFKKWNVTDFQNDIALYKEIYTSDMLNRFYTYWSEKTPSGKMRFQLEKTWETSKRLVTWKNNQKAFDKVEQTNRGGSTKVKAL